MSCVRCQMAELIATGRQWLADGRLESVMAKRDVTVYIGETLNEVSNNDALSLTNRRPSTGTLMFQATC